GAGGAAPLSAQMSSGAAARDAGVVSRTSATDRAASSAGHASAASEMDASMSGSTAPANAGSGAGEQSADASSHAMPPGPRRPQLSGELVITELMSNPAAVADTAGEWIELYNPSADEALDLEGCTLDDGGSRPHAIATGFVIAAGAYATIVRGPDVGFAGDLV